MATIMERIKNIQDKDKFTEAVKNVKTAEEMVEVINAFGVEATLEEIETEFYSVFNDETGEIDENSLNDVVGGCSCGGWLQHKLYQFGRWIIKAASGRDIGECW